jgi:hypothetical protein
MALNATELNALTSVAALLHGANLGANSRAAVLDVLQLVERMAPPVAQGATGFIEPFAPHVVPRLRALAMFYGESESAAEQVAQDWAAGREAPPSSMRLANGKVLMSGSVSFPQGWRYAVLDVGTGEVYLEQQTILDQLSADEKVVFRQAPVAFHLSHEDAPTVTLKPVAVTLGCGLVGTRWSADSRSLAALDAVLFQRWDTRYRLVEVSSAPGEEFDRQTLSFYPDLHSALACAKECADTRPGDEFWVIDQVIEAPVPGQSPKMDVVFKSSKTTVQI